MAPAALPGNDIEEMILQHIRQIIEGQQQPYSRDTIERLRGTALRTAKGQAAQRRAQLDEDLVTSGTFRSGLRARGQQDIEREASASYSAEANKIELTAAIENYRARLDGLTRAQTLLDQRRAYLLATEDNRIKLQIGMAQIQLGYARIAAEREMLELQLSRVGGGGGGPSDEDLLRDIIFGSGGG